MTISELIDLLLQEENKERLVVLQSDPEGQYLSEK